MKSTRIISLFVITVAVVAGNGLAAEVKPVEVKQFLGMWGRKEREVADIRWLSAMVVGDWCLRTWVRSLFVGMR